MDTYITLIRHGTTAGNRKGQYIGRTDESLDEEGIRELSSSSFPFVSNVVVSPLKRCRESAAILFPGAEQQVAAGLRECDFGRYEGRTYEELLDDPVYQQFLQTGELKRFPGGEAVAEFKARCIRTFARLLKEAAVRETPELFLVVHGGTIMAIMEAFARPQRSYYDWQVENGCGWRVRTRTDAGQQEQIYIEVVQKVERT